MLTRAHPPHDVRQPRQRDAKEVIGELQRIDRSQLNLAAIGALVDCQTDFSPVISDDGALI